MLRAPVSPYFSQWIRNVPIERTIAKVQALLESEECEEPVVLFGGPAEGKTCMARHLALVYQLSGHNAPVNASSTGQSSSYAGKFSDGVFFFKCGKTVDGNHIDSLVLLKELAEGLGGYSRLGTEEIIEDTQTRVRKLREDVFKKLQYQNVLIILDDVWDTDIVSNMFVKASGVKYLITTQFERIWPDAEQANRVKIDLPNLQEARGIIANLRFQKNQIPNNLKDPIEKIIQKVKFHPYEIANVAFAIKDDKALEAHEWQSKLRDVSYLREGDPRRGPRAFGRSYSKKTLPDAILLGVDNFCKKTRSLLYMAAICISESVPEQVFKLFFDSIHSGCLEGFFSCRSDLEDAGLLQVENKKVLESLELQSFWSIYGRRQDVIRQKRNVEIESLVSTCLERDKSSDENEPDVLALLVILYGRLDWREKAARKTGILVSKMTEETSRERNSVTLFVHLLFAGGGDGWEKQPHMWAKKVIWKYLIKGELDDSSMSDLLNFSRSALISCGALWWMAGELVYTRQLFTTQHQATLQGLLKFLSDDSDSVFKILVTQVLVWLSYPRFEGWNATRVMVLIQPDFLPNVLVLLRANNADLMGATADALTALGNLAFDKDQSLLIGNFSESVMLEVIIGFVKEAVDSRVQAMSLYALGRLCFSEEIMRKILQFPGLLSRVVQFLAKSTATKVRVKSINLLIQICKIMDDKIIEGGLVPGTVERLVALMAEGMNQDVQLEAVRALAFFRIPLGLLSYPTMEKGIEMVVLTQTDFLHNSLQLLLLGNKTSADLLQYTLIAIGNLADNEDARLSIGNFSGMLGAIIEMTEDDMETRVQENALFALRRLSFSAVIARHMLRVSGFLARVVHFCDKTRAEKVQMESIQLLRVMCAAMGDKIMKRGLVPGTVERLVALTAADVNQDVQLEAVRALAFHGISLGLLSYPTTEKGIEMVVLTQTDFLHNSLQLLLLGNKTSVDLLPYTVNAIGKFANNEDARLSIGNFSGMLGAIIEMTEEDVETRVQENALFALRRLSVSAVIARHMLRVSGFLARVVHFCDKTRAKKVQMESIQLLRVMCAAMGDKIMEGGLVPNTVKRLVALMAEDVNQDVQLEAVRALAFHRIPLGLLSYPTTEKGIEMVVLTQTNFLHNSLQLLLLGSTTSADLLQNTLNAIGNFADNEDARLSIGNFSGMLGAIIEMTEEDVETQVQENALFALRRLSASAVIARHMLEVSEFVARVVHFCDKSRATEVQAESIRLLRFMCIAMEDKINEGGLVPGTVERLVALMAKDVNQDVQLEAVRALAFQRIPLGLLSYPTTEKGIEMVVLTQTDLLHNSLQLLLLRNKTSANILQNTLFAIGNFADNEDARLLIGNFSGMLEAIIEMSEDDVETGVQENALFALRRLSISAVIARHMLEVSGFLARVVHFPDKSRATEVQAKSIRLLRQMCATMGDKINEGGLVPGTVERLVALMAKDVNHDVQLEAVRALAFQRIPLGLLSYPATEKGIEMVVLTQTDFLHNSLQLLLLRNRTSAGILWNTLIAIGNFADNEDARLSIGNFSGMLEAIIDMTEEDVETRVQENALFALCRLLYSPLLCKKVVGIAGVLERFVELLEKDVSQNVKVHVAWAMSYISEYEEMRKVIRGTSNVVSILADLIANDTKPHADLAHGAVKTITLIDFDNAEKLVLKTADAYRGRGSAKMILGRYNDALTDCDSGLDIDHGHYALLSQRSFVKAMLKDYSGSVKDISRAMEIKPDDSYLLQERGVLMRLIGDLDAALSDLNTALKLDPDDYEMLKHRGYVKFLLGDEEGAREDAELAILRKHQDSLPHGAPVKCLGALPVKYLEYKL